MSQLNKMMSQLIFSLSPSKNRTVGGGWPQGVGLVAAFLARGPVEKRVLTVLI